jgi:uncharacterized protein (TIRG00374 family)
MKLSKRTVSSIVALALIIYIIRLVDYELLRRQLTDNIWGIIFLIFLGIILQLLRLFRNYYLLLIAEYTDISIKEFLPQGLIGNTISTYGPAKSGEIVVAQIYDSHFNIKVSESMSVIVIGRALDIVIVIALALSGLTIIPRSSIQGFIFLLTLIILIVGTLLALLLNEKYGTMVFAKLISLIPKKFNNFKNRLLIIMNQYYQALPGVVSKPKSRLTLLIFTFVRWTIEVFSFWYLLVLFGFSVPIYFVTPIIGFTYAIGVASGTPGSLGTAQFTTFSFLTLVMLISVDVASTIITLGLSIGTTIQILQISIGLVWYRLTNLNPKN